MNDIPVLTELLNPELPVAKLNFSASISDKLLFAPTFFKFFFLAEEMRQRLFERFEYRVSRRIENYQDGSLAVKFICPPYGKNEPGAQPKQITLSVESLAPAQKMDEALSFLNGVFTFYVKREEMSAIASDVISNLTPEQREALRWSIGAK
jgi:hypothetical protein